MRRDDEAFAIEFQFGQAADDERFDGRLVAIAAEFPIPEKLDFVFLGHFEAWGSNDLTVSRDVLRRPGRRFSNAASIHQPPVVRKRGFNPPRFSAFPGSA